MTIIKVNDSISGGYTDVSWSSKWILAIYFFLLVQRLNDFKGQRINVGRFESSLVSKTEKKILLKCVS